MKDKILHMLAATALFAAIGWFIPEIYFRHFDTRQYYQIENPITIHNKPAVACENVEVHLNRKSSITTDAVSIIQLNLVNTETKETTRVYNQMRNVAIKELNEFQSVELLWDLPCNLKSGKYYFDGVISYKVRDISKSTAFYSEMFDVIATDSAKIK